MMTVSEQVPIRGLGGRQYGSNDEERIGLPGLSFSESRAMCIFGIVHFVQPQTKVYYNAYSRGLPMHLNQSIRDVLHTLIV